MTQACSTDKKEEDRLNQMEIEKMIASESDPQIRLQLIIMNRISQNLAANTKSIQLLESEFTKHAKEEEERINKGKGLAMAGKYAIGIIQLIIIWMGNALMDDLKHIHDDMRNMQINQATMQSNQSAVIDRVGALETAKIERGSRK